MNQSRYDMSILEVTIHVRSAMEQDIHHPSLQVVIGSEYVSGDSGGEVTTKLFLVRAVEREMRKERQHNRRNRRTDFARRPFVWHMRTQSWSHEGDQGVLSPLSEGTLLCRETRMLKGMR